MNGKRNQQYLTKVLGIISLLCGKILAQKRWKIILPEEDIDFDEEEIDLDGNRNGYIIMDLSLLNNALPERACCKNCRNI